MNKQYRVVFNQQRNAFVVVSENTHTQGKSACQSQVSSHCGEAVLTAVVAATAVGSGVLSTSAYAENFTVSSNSKYQVGKASGEYQNNFFRPGYAGSAGFFYDQGATNALDIVTGKHSESPPWIEFANVELNATNDATNLKNMKDSLNMVSRSNELRQKEAQDENKTIPDLKVTHSAMAIAQIRLDWKKEWKKAGHAPQEGVTYVSENLAAGFKDGAAAASGWYGEKTSNGEKGHYHTLVNTDNVVTGSAVTGPYGRQGGVYLAEWQLNAPYKWKFNGNDKRYTPDEYEALLDAYIAKTKDTNGWLFLESGNTVNVKSDVGSQTQVAGGYAVSGKSATNNTVNIDNKANVGTIYGGYAQKGNVSGNTVNINGGTVDTVYGGFVVNGAGKVENNVININGGTIKEVSLGNTAKTSGTINTNGGTVSGSLKANGGVLNINAKNNTLKAGSVNGFDKINFSNLSSAHTALQITGNHATDFGDKITLSGSLNDYNDGKKYSLIQAANAISVSENLFAQNTVTDNVFNILSDAQYEVKEFGFHQDDAKKSLYIADEIGKRNIINKQFNAANHVKNAVVNINKSGDYQGLNVSIGGSGSTINWLWGRNFGEINAQGGTLNIGSVSNPIQMNQRTASNISNIGALNFYLPDNIVNNDWALQLSSNKATDLSNTAITAYLSGDKNINNKDTVHLIQKTNGGEIKIGSGNKVVVQQGVTLTSTAQMGLSGDKLNLDLVFDKSSSNGSKPSNSANNGSTNSGSANNGSANGKQNTSTNGSQSGSANGKQNTSTNGNQSGSANGKQNTSTNSSQSGSANGKQNTSTNGSQSGSANSKQNTSTNESQSSSTTGKQNTSTNGSQSGSANGKQNTSTNGGQSGSANGKQNTSTNGSQSSSANGKQNTSTNESQSTAANGNTNTSQDGMITWTVNDKTKSLLETILVAPAMVNQSSEDISGSLSETYSATGLNNNVAGGAVFASTGLGDQRINSGSHIDVTGGSVKAGYAHNFKNENSTTLASVFAEYGYGDYDSQLDDGTRGKGKTQHFGAGVFANHSFENGLYIQGSIKAGQVKSDYESSDLGSHALGDTVNYETDSTYIGTHIGVGQVMQLGENSTLDAYAKYFYTRTSADDAKLSSGETYNFDGVDSHRLRIGARYEYAINNNVGVFAGGAFEREFDAEASARYQGFNLPSPSMKGNTGIVEAGVSTSGTVKVEASIQGFGGKRRGAGLNIGIKF